MDLCFLANIFTLFLKCRSNNLYRGLRHQRCWTKEKLDKNVYSCCEKSAQHILSSSVCVPPPPDLYLVGSRTACSLTVEHNQHICKRKAGLWIKPFILSYHVVIQTQRLSKAYTLHSNPPCIRKPKRLCQKVPSSAGF